jgi:hypothetical protein
MQNNSHEGAKTVQLGDILTNEQIEAIRDILVSSQGGSEAITKLKAYLLEFRDELEAKGLNTDCLAYAILDAASRMDF